jgi:hypothetical protein
MLLHHARSNRLREGADLVDLEQEAVASLLLNSSLDADGVGDRQVVTDNLDASLLGEVAPSLPVI